MDLLPPKQVADRLVMRYFSTNRISQHVIHKPALTRRYNEFWADMSSPTVDMDWFALLFMVFAQAVFFAHSTTSEDLVSDSLPLTPMQRFRQYRADAGWALTSASPNGRSYGYSSPAM